MPSDLSALLSEMRAFAAPRRGFNVSADLANIVDGWADRLEDASDAEASHAALLTEKKEKGDTRMDTPEVISHDSSTAPAALPGSDPLCCACNPLVQAYCKLRKGHEGPHWGHGPVWQWDDVGIMCETVAPSEAPPDARTL